MAGIRAEEVNRPREVREAEGGSGHSYGMPMQQGRGTLIRSHRVGGHRLAMRHRSNEKCFCLGYTFLEEFKCDNFAGSLQWQSRRSRRLGLNQPGRTRC